MNQKNIDERIKEAYSIRRNRQLFAVTLAFFLVIFLTLIYKKTALFGESTKQVVFVGQLSTIVAFIIFSAVNWKCPSCGRYMGNDLWRRFCKHCRQRFW